MTSAPELDWLLDEMVGRVPGIRKALILTRDGLAVGASAMLSREDAERLSAIAAAFHSLARGAVRELGGEEARQVLVEMDVGFFFATAAGEDGCLAVITSAQADIGLVAYEMEMLIKRVSDHVDHLAVRHRPAPSGGEVM
jgi:predicted regulator of Ras-like GTPase activity (Roadblock/LC7/MglB family)